MLIRHPNSARGNDLYETPEAATLALLAVEPLPPTILEPACGPGAIVRVLRDAGHQAIATDLIDYRSPDQDHVGCDIPLKHGAPDGVEMIVTNPSFKLAAQFAAHALSLCPHVAMQLRLSFLESGNEKTKAGQARPHVVDLAKHWPGIPPKSDVSDWLAVGNSRKDLDALIDQAAEHREAAPATGLGEWNAAFDVELPPPRSWLLGNSFCRRFVSSVLADGGAGKSAPRILQGLSLATARRLSGEQVFQRCRALIVSLEDDPDELHRSILAARLHYNIPLSEFDG
jgi:hypothetical protein